MIFFVVMRAWIKINNLYNLVFLALRKMIEAAGVNLTTIMTISDPNYPQGCILSPKVSNSFAALFNKAASSPATSCGNASKVALKGSANLGPHSMLIVI